MSSSRNGRTVIFTIASSNYIAYAATLMQSVKEFHPDAILVVVLADPERSFPDVNLPAEVWPCDRLAIPAIESMKTYYSVIEFNTAIKPYAFKALFEHYNAESVIYLDPDIRLFSRMTEVLAALDSHSIVLTPHVMAPLQDGLEPSDHTIMKSGIYNFGFFAARADADAHRLIDWWADRLRAHCRVDIAGNMFTDQRWMDMSPVLVEKPYILRHPGYNVAYWNLAQRTVTQTKQGTWTVNGEPLIFFHFSGIVPNDPTVFSKYQNRFTPADIGEAATLCDLYRTALHANNWQQYKRVRYGYDQFSDGSRIEHSMRRWLLRAIDDGRLTDGVPADLNAAFFDQPDDDLERSGAVITRFMGQLWRDRDDLRAAFRLSDEQGRAAYLEWFLRDAIEQGVSSRAVEAAADANGRNRVAHAAVTDRQAPPWQSIAALEGIAATARPAEQILQHDVIFQIGGQTEEIPAAMALAWERRQDLQTAFPLSSKQDLVAFKAWAMTHGILEHELQPQHLTRRFIASCNKLSPMASLYGDIPVTEGLIATRGVDVGRTGFGDISRFPTDRKCRDSHALWYAYWAPHHFGWPAALADDIRNYYSALTNIGVAGFQLNRGEVALWEVRPDVRQAFPLAEVDGVANYLFWIASHGLDEVGIQLQDFDPRLIEWLQQDDPDVPGITRFVRLAHANRPDVHRAFDLSTSTGRKGLAKWARHHALAEYSSSQFVRSADVITKRSVPTPLRVGVILTGYWTAPTGRGEDLRCTHHAFKAIGYGDYLIADLGTRSFISPTGETVTVTGPVHAGVNIVHTNADTAARDASVIASMNITADRKVGYWAWELERMPRWWRHSYVYYDEIWASTRFAHDAFAAEGLRPVVHIPLAVHMNDTTPRPARGKLGWEDDETVFLFVFDLRSFVSRKNPEAVIRAFQLAFPQPAERVRLIIKTQGGRDRPADLESLQRLCSDHRIEIIDGEMPRDELLTLMQSADCFVSLHRSEGFGRGPAEAMLLGKPVIVTDYSGTADFADESCAMPVAYDLAPVQPGEYPGADGQRWADPKVDNAAEQMRLVRNDAARTKSIGDQARTRVMALFAPRVVGEKIAAHLELRQFERRRPELAAHQARSK